MKKAKEKIEKSLANNYYLWTREWSYKGVKPRIIAEKYMFNSKTTANETESLKDYKFYCFNGEPQYLYVSHQMDNHSKARVSFVDKDWKKAPFGRTDYKEFEVLPEKPQHFEDMLKLARILSKNIAFLRVDLYEINDKIYFGELTFFDQGGFDTDITLETDLKWGELMDLDKIK